MDQVQITNLILNYGAIGAMLFALIRFSKKFIDRLEDCEERLEEFEEIVKEAKKRDDVILQALLDLINHSIDGNGIQQMKQTRAKIIERLSVK